MTGSPRAQLLGPMPAFRIWRFLFRIFQTAASCARLSAGPASSCLKSTPFLSTVRDVVFKARVVVHGSFRLGGYAGYNQAWLAPCTTFAGAEHSRPHAARDVHALWPTPGGYVWVVVEPLAAILFLSNGFSLLLRSTSLGTSFILFHATGYLVFNLYEVLASSTAAAIKFSKLLLMYTALNLFDAVIVRFVLNSLTGIITSIILIITVLSIVETRTVIDLGPIVEAFSLAMLLGFRKEALNCTLIGLFPVWGVIWTVINWPLFLA